MERALKLIAKFLKTCIDDLYISEDGDILITCSEDAQGNETLVFFNINKACLVWYFPTTDTEIFQPFFTEESMLKELKSLKESELIARYSECAKGEIA